MNDRRLLLVLAGVFGTLAVLLAFLGATVTPVALGVALPFAGVAYLLWYHATGRLEARAHERARSANRTERERRAAGARVGGRDTETGGGSRQTRASERRAREAMSEPEARETLGVGRNAEGATLRRAYRERVKEVHPDRDGDEEAFQRVQRAYERLREE